MSEVGTCVVQLEADHRRTRVRGLPACDRGYRGAAKDVARAWGWYPGEYTVELGFSPEEG